MLEFQESNKLIIFIYLYRKNDHEIGDPIKTKCHLFYGSY